MPIHITDEPRSFVKKYPKIKKRHFWSNLGMDLLWNIF
jgi:hypothetical protein